MRNVIKSTLNYILLIILVQGLSSISVLAQESNMDKEIFKAFDLRTHGENEEAKLILENVLKSDSSNAIAHFEMSRLETDQKKFYHADKAILFDSKNTMYRFYRANLSMLEAYKAMQMGNNELILAHVDTCTTFLKGLVEIKPDCKESILFLVDIYGNLPEDMGGDKEQAKYYSEMLKPLDPLYAKQAEVILAANKEDFDVVKYWQDYIDENGESTDALVKLGNANLLNNDIKSAEVCFNKVLALDNSQNVLYLQIARAHLYRAMGGGENADEEIAELKRNINKYLEVEEIKEPCIEAWCYSWLARLEQRQGNEELAKSYMEKSNELIPNMMVFTALPKVDAAPNIIAYKYKTYFAPF